MTEGPVDVGTAVLDAGMAGGWICVPRGHDNLAANPTAGAKEDAVGIPPVVGSGGRWHACSWLYISCIGLSMSLSADHLYLNLWVWSTCGVITWI